MITVFTVDAALQHTCAVLREQAKQGHISPTERDLLIDGAILLAMHVDELAQDAHIGAHSGGLAIGPIRTAAATVAA